MAERILTALTSAGTTHTNSTDEAALASHTFPADFFDEGKVIRFRALCVVADQNSTDTLTVNARFGGTTLTGTAFITTGAVDVADGDIAYIEGELVCRSTGSTGAFVGLGSCVLDAPGTATVADGEVLSSIDTTAALYLEITGDWSVAHADNQVACQSFTVTELVD